LAWYLYLLVSAIGIVYVVWILRKKAAEKASASKARFEQLFGAPEQGPGVRDPGPAVSPAGGAATVAKAPVRAAAFVAKEQFLGQSEATFYRLLKAGVPDHEVFAHVTLASVVGVPDGVSGNAREQQLRRLAQYQLDFVVCDKSLRVIAAVELDSARAADAAGVQRFKADCLKAAGIRLVRVNPSEPPRREDIRSLITGAGG